MCRAENCLSLSRGIINSLRSLGIVIDNRATIAKKLRVCVHTHSSWKHRRPNSRVPRGSEKKQKGTVENWLLKYNDQYIRGKKRRERLCIMYEERWLEFEARYIRSFPIHYFRSVVSITCHLTQSLHTLLITLYYCKNIFAHLCRRFNNYRWTVLTTIRSQNYSRLLNLSQLKYDDLYSISFGNRKIIINVCIQWLCDFFRIENMKDKYFEVNKVNSSLLRFKIILLKSSLYFIKSNNFLDGWGRKYYIIIPLTARSPSIWLIVRNICSEMMSKTLNGSRSNYVLEKSVYLSVDLWRSIMPNQDIVQRSTFYMNELSNPQDFHTQRRSAGRR